MGAGEFAGKGYADDLNNEVGYFTVGMFNKDSKNIPSFDEGGNTVGVFANFRAKFSAGVFMFQIAIPLGQSSMFVRLLWNQTWYSWRMCRMIDQYESQYLILFFCQQPLSFHSMETTLFLRSNIFKTLIDFCWKMCCNFLCYSYIVFHNR